MHSGRFLDHLLVPQITTILNLTPLDEFRLI
jgi:hypothetical protein